MVGSSCRSWWNHRNSRAFPNIAGRSYRFENECGLISLPSVVIELWLLLLLLLLMVCVCGCMILVWLYSSIDEWMMSVVVVCPVSTTIRSKKLLPKKRTLLAWTRRYIHFARQNRWIARYERRDSLLVVSLHDTSQIKQHTNKQHTNIPSPVIQSSLNQT